MNIYESNSFILKPSDATNFRYRIVGKELSEEEVVEINNISGEAKIRKRVRAIQNSSCLLDFDEVTQQTFSNNLVLIDSALPKILASMVLKAYSSNSSKISDLLSKVEEDNVLGFNSSSGHPFYQYKIKRLLIDTALGMTPAKVWDGHYDATGGYLIVKNDGDIVCYHMYEKSRFENYLLNNTKLETASSSRYEFGEIYNEKGCLYINLNLQIRFIK